MSLLIRNMYNNPEKMVKARIAETIVEEMLREADYQVYRFGYESVLQNLVQKENSFDKFDVFGTTIAKMPDFLVVKNKKPNFVEVKFRKTGILKPNEFKKWGESRIILVMPFEPYFKVSTVSAFRRTGKLYNLEKDLFFKIEKEIIKKYIPLVEKYLKE